MQNQKQQAAVPFAPSLSRLMFDADAYKTDVKQLVGPGRYVLSEVAAPNCRPCLAVDPRIAIGTSGTAECKSVPLVDIESDLHNIGRKATLAPEGLYRGGVSSCGGGVGGGTATKSRECGCATYSAFEAQPQQCSTAHPACAGLPTVDTRLANPPCTLRGTGWNRWEWLCTNPQERALLPFDTNVDTSIVVKDNHRPHLARPMDPTSVLPPRSRDVDPTRGMPAWEPHGACHGIGPHGEPPLITWQRADAVRDLMSSSSSSTR